MTVKNDLLQHNVILEHVGGDVLSVEVSAKDQVHLDKLVETIKLQEELLELKANPDRPGERLVVESRLERGKGVVATVLVQRGTIHSGDILVAGGAWGRGGGVGRGSGRGGGCILFTSAAGDE